MTESIAALSDTELLLVAARRIKAIAFDIPPPNVHTPRLLELAIALEQECYRRQASAEAAARSRSKPLPSPTTTAEA